MIWRQQLGGGQFTGDRELFFVREHFFVTLGERSSLRRAQDLQRLRQVVRINPEARRRATTDGRRAGALADLVYDIASASRRTPPETGQLWTVSTARARPTSDPSEACRNYVGPSLSYGTHYTI